MFKLPRRVSIGIKRVCVVGDLSKWDTNANLMQKLKNVFY